MSLAAAKRNVRDIDGDLYAGSLEGSNRQPECWGAPCATQDNRALLQMWRVKPSSGKLCQAQATVSFEAALSKGAVNNVHDVHTVC